jgi:hypothetical protein
MQHKSYLPVMLSKKIYECNLIGAGELFARWRTSLFFVCAAIFFAGAVDCSANPAGKSQSVHQLKAVEEVHSGDVFVVHAQAKAGEHGIYILDSNCGDNCEDILSVSINNNLIVNSDIKKFVISVNKTRSNIASYLDIEARVSLNFVKVPNKTRNTYYRVASVNLLSVEKQDFFDGDHKPKGNAGVIGEGSRKGGHRDETE